MEPSTTDRVFAALAHPMRRRMIDLLVELPGMSVSALATNFDCSRIAVTKHVAALENAELVLSERVGRKRRLFFNVIPIQQIYDRWTTRYSAFWAQRMTDLEARIEARRYTEEEESSA
jgi:DNA-binding transcriptional ArsR family regulator